MVTNYHNRAVDKDGSQKNQQDKRLISDADAMAAKGKQFADRIGRGGVAFYILLMY
jgi:hypothetical protein